jgi:hypothetical protein
MSVCLLLVSGGVLLGSGGVLLGSGGVLFLVSYFGSVARHWPNNDVMIYLALKVLVVWE